ncbi:response regulator transcription factor [Rhodopirellula islandica]|uniref:response regulator transcription factor n=1 Tax=Rhodopirellula islandica TaxID=595434 RepID=UPI00064A3C8D|nr:LuxR C-terminal-related transcriptional regulator [Rhodopirellula islandica]
MNKSTVFLIRESPSRGDSVSTLLRSNGMAVVSFDHPSQFYETYNPDIPGCMVLDLSDSLVAGITLAEQISEKGYCPPYIIVGGEPRTCDLARAMRSGAQDFFDTPLDGGLFIARVREAMKQDQQRRLRWQTDQSLLKRVDSLSPREREILTLVMDGKLSKQIASQLDISVKTVEAHRANILRKMHVDSFIQVVCLIANKQDLLDTSSCDAA